MRQAVEKVCALLATTEEEGRSGKLSDQSEVLLHNSVAISNSESFMGTHGTVIKAFSFALYFVLHSLLPGPTPAFVACMHAVLKRQKAGVGRPENEAGITSFPSLAFANIQKLVKSL